MKLVSIRSVMGEMPAQDIAVAGNAIAMAGWHKVGLAHLPNVHRNHMQITHANTHTHTGIFFMKIRII
jgi:hypothetical protein